MHLDTLSALSQHCDVHLFFNNACREYWGDIIDQSHWQRLKVRERITWQDFQQPPQIHRLGYPRANTYF